MNAVTPTDFRAARRIAAMGVSEILQITFRASAMKRAGEDLIVLGAGEPDFDTPGHVKDAAAKAMREGATKYTPLDGTPELKAAIIAKFERDNGLSFCPDEVTAATGGKQILFNAFMATLDPGDEVLIPAPYWTSYADIVLICGGVPVIVPCAEAEGFRLQPAALNAAVTPRTRWLLLNSPSNPSGAGYRAEDLQGLAAALECHPGIWVLSDDMYEHILYDGVPFATMAQASPALRGRTLTMNGVSKAYAMTGWRIGYAGGPSALIKAMAIVQSQSTSCPSSISQAAATAALEGPQELLAERRASFQQRRDLVVNGLNAVPGLRCPMPIGAFYAFASCEGVIGRRGPNGTPILSDRDYCAYLLNEAKVAVVPGTCFGLAPYFRVSYATSEAELVEAVARIAMATGRLQGG
jgi:aspartate aminotransferase